MDLSTYSFFSIVSSTGVHDQISGWVHLQILRNLATEG